MLAEIFLTFCQLLLTFALLCVFIPSRDKKHLKINKFYGEMSGSGLKADKIKKVVHSVGGIKSEKISKKKSWCKLKIIHQLNTSLFQNYIRTNLFAGRGYKPAYRIVMV